MSKWQPIETAPMDGTKILAYTPDGVNGPDYAVASWYASEIDWFEPVGELFRKVTREFGTWVGSEHDPFRATHWMPLPEPPEGT